MSEIDSYQHRCIGLVACPARFSLVWEHDPNELAQSAIPLYRLEEDAPEARSFRAKRGDILLGGGSGEQPALRLAIPEAFYFFTHPEWPDFKSIDDVVEAFWTMTDAYIFGDGYQRLGWTPNKPIEYWLAEHILSYLVRFSTADYLPILGTSSLAEDGSICRQPTADELVQLSSPNAR